MFHAFKLILGLLVLTSCAHPFVLSQPKPDEALVYVYRVRNYAISEDGPPHHIMVRLNVDDDYSQISSSGGHAALRETGHLLAPDRYVELRLNPGLHTLKLHKAHASWYSGNEVFLDESRLEINLDAGMTYFIGVGYKVSLSPSEGSFNVWKGQFQWTQKTESEAIQHLGARYGGTGIWTP